MSRGIEIAAWCVVIKDGELKVSAAGNSYATVLVMADSGHNDDRGQAIGAFLKVVAFGGLASVAANLRKGMRTYLEGVLSVGIWTPENGSPKPDLSVKVFRLEPTQIGKNRPQRDGQKIDSQAPLESRERAPAPAFDDALDF